MGIRVYTRTGKKTGVSMGLGTYLIVGFAFWMFVGALAVGIVRVLWPVLAVIAVIAVVAWVARTSARASKAREVASARQEAIDLFNQATALLEAGERPSDEERAKLDKLATSVILSRPSLRDPLGTAACSYAAALRASDQRVAS